MAFPSDLVANNRMAGRVSLSTVSGMSGGGATGGGDDVPVKLADAAELEWAPPLRRGQRRNEVGQRLLWVEPLAACPRRSRPKASEPLVKRALLRLSALEQPDNRERSLDRACHVEDAT